MALRFWYELTVGVITLIAILIFGVEGIKAIVLLALLPFIMRIKKIKADERETLLFYKGTQIIFTTIIFLIVVSFVFAGLNFADLFAIQKETWFIILAAFLIINGLVRIYLLYKN